jgi:hypothetical protein
MFIFGTDLAYSTPENFFYVHSGDAGGMSDPDMGSDLVVTARNYILFFFSKFLL